MVDGPFELVKHRPWATVWRVPSAGASVYFKACRPIQAFEPGLTAALASRWPSLTVDVLAFDAGRGWLLTADAGAPLGDLGNPPARWAEILPRYAELQRGEAQHVSATLGLGVPDLSVAVLPARFDELLAGRLPLEPGEIRAARELRPTLEQLLAEVATTPIAMSIDHADLHLRSVFAGDTAPGHAASGDAASGRGQLRILDWGDASVGHPFASLVVTFAFLRESNGLAPDDPWFGRLRDAYLEPWGSGLVQVFEAAQRLGAITRAIGWGRHFEAMGHGAFPGFDEQFPDVLRTAFEAIRSGEQVAERTSR